LPQKPIQTLFGNISPVNGAFKLESKQQKIYCLILKVQKEWNCQWKPKLWMFWHKRNYIIYGLQGKK